MSKFFHKKWYIHFGSFLSLESLDYQSTSLGAEDELVLVSRHFELTKTEGEIPLFWCKEH